MVISRSSRDGVVRGNLVMRNHGAGIVIGTSAYAAMVSDPVVDDDNSNSNGIATCDLIKFGELEAARFGGLRSIRSCNDETCPGILTESLRQMVKESLLASRTRNRELSVAEEKPIGDYIDYYLNGLQNTLPKNLAESLSQGLTSEGAMPKVIQALEFNELEEVRSLAVHFSDPNNRQFLRKDEVQDLTADQLVVLRVVAQRIMRPREMRDLTDGQLARMLEIFRAVELRLVDVSLTHEDLRNMDPPDLLALTTRPINSLTPEDLLDLTTQDQQDSKREVLQREVLGDLGLTDQEIQALSASQLDLVRRQKSEFQTLTPGQLQPLLSGDGLTREEIRLLVNRQLRELDLGGKDLLSLSRVRPADGILTSEQLNFVVAFGDLTSSETEALTCEQIEYLVNLQRMDTGLGLRPQEIQALTGEQLHCLVVDTGITSREIQALTRQQLQSLILENLEQVEDRAVESTLTKVSDGTTAVVSAVDPVTGALTLIRTRRGRFDGDQESGDLLIDHEGIERTITGISNSRDISVLHNIALDNGLSEEFVIFGFYILNATDIRLNGNITGLTDVRPTEAQPHFGYGIFRSTNVYTPPSGQHTDYEDLPQNRHIFESFNVEPIIDEGDESNVQHTDLHQNNSVLDNLLD